MTNLLELDDGVTVTYDVLGEGVPILGLPGGPGIAAGYVASFAAGLTDVLSWHLIDPPGTGGSTPADDYSIDAHVRFYREAASNLGLDHYLLFGHSYSGTVASTFAARHPDRVRGCLLAAPPVVGVEPDMAEGGGIRASMNALMARHADQPWYADAVKAEFEPDLSDPVGSMLRGLRLYFSDPDDELFEATLAAIGPIELNFDAVVSFYEKEWRPLDLRPLLPTIPCPLLAVVGEHDWAVPPVQARYYEELVPDGRTVEIPNCGHWLQIEAPATWRATVRDWLADVL